MVNIFKNWSTQSTSVIAEMYLRIRNSYEQWLLGIKYLHFCDIISSPQDLTVSPQPFFLTCSLPASVVFLTFVNLLSVLFYFRLFVYILTDICTSILVLLSFFFFSGQGHTWKGALAILVLACWRELTSRNCLHCHGSSSWLGELIHIKFLRCNFSLS